MAASMGTIRTCLLKNSILLRNRGTFPSGVGLLCHVHRTLLSKAYWADDLWLNRKRLEVNVDDLRLKLDQNLVILEKPVASVELQMFIDNIINEDELNASEKYLYSFRHTPLAHHLRPYTVHSWLRVCLDFHQPLRALKALQNKTHFGLFPDAYTFNLLLDHFIKMQEYENAYLVAKELMLTEVMDSSTPLTQSLAVYVCHKVLQEKAVQQEDRKDFGMTLADATRGSHSCLSRSYHLLGYCMVGNKKAMTKLLSAWLSEESDAIITKEVFDTLEESLKEMDSEGEYVSQLQEQLQLLEASGRLEETSNEELVKRDLLPRLAELEKEDIENYPQVLKSWIESCEEAIKRQEEEKKAMERAAKEARLEELMKEVGGVEYWIERAKREGKEVRDRLLEEEIKTQ